MMKTGKLSGPLLAEAAHSALHEAHPTSTSTSSSSTSAVHRIAALHHPAGEGKASKHAHRGVLRAFAKGCGLPPTYVANIRVWDDAKAAQTQKPMSFLLPHEMLDYFLERDPGHEWTSIGEHQQNVGADLHKWGARLGADTVSGPWVALGLWGDGAVSFKKDQVYLLTWRALTGSKLDRYWIAAFSKKELCKCGCFGRHTIDDIFRIISWSFQVLLSGVSRSATTKTRSLHTPTGQFVPDAP